MRIVFDTSVLVSAVLLPRSIPRQAFDHALGAGTILVSEATLAELDEVLRRPKFERYQAEDRRREFMAGLVADAELIEIDQSVAACRDPKDDKFLELALCGRASVIVTGDADLLVLHPFRETAILTPQAYLYQQGIGQPDAAKDRPS